MRSHTDEAGQTDRESKACYNKETTSKVLAATKKGDDNYLPKKVLSTAMNVEKVLDHFILGQTPLLVLPKPTKIKAEKRITKMVMKAERTEEIIEGPPRYDVVTAFAISASEISFRHIHQRDEVEAQ